MSKLILIRGKVNAGKTTTAGLLYQKLITVAEKNHSFNGADAFEDSLKYNKKGNTKDFVTTMTINKHTVVIISAGDDADYLKKQLEFHTQFDIIICCSRTANREGSSYRMILDNFAEKNPIILEEWITKDKLVTKEIAKKDAVKKIFDTVVKETK